MELGLQDDPGLGAYFDDVDVAHFIIQAMANAFVSGADEVALHKLVDYPLARPSGQGARVAVRYMSHISRQHPNRASGRPLAESVRPTPTWDLCGSICRVQGLLPACSTTVPGLR